MRYLAALTLVLIWLPIAPVGAQPAGPEWCETPEAQSIYIRDPQVGWQAQTRAAGWSISRFSRLYPVLVRTGLGISTAFLVQMAFEPAPQPADPALLATAHCYFVASAISNGF